VLGQLGVADTGNKRVVFFGPGGERRSAVGPGVDAPPPLDEPTGLARDGNQTLLVADMWNQRILRLDRFARTLAAWPVPGWDSRDADDKPAVAVDAAGRVYASDPESGQVLVFTPAGALEASLRVSGAGGTAAKPTGVAIDEKTGKLLVVDRAGGRLLVMPAYRPAR
jgi:DNA-binding beta-propeller fold protein YncE